MMTSVAALYGGALSLGLLTSISPCPLATNLAATSFLARRVGSRKRAVGGALAYTLGRVAVYVLIAVLLSLGFASAPDVSHSLQRWMPPLLGPLLVLMSMVLLGLISLPLPSLLTSQSGAERWAERGLIGEFVLGFVFALSFCPVSAALFFGSLIPMTIRSGQALVPVTLYGIGTAAPVAALALLMIFSARAASRLAGGITRIQPWLLKITGAVLLATGLFLTARDTLGIIA